MRPKMRPLKQDLSIYKKLKLENPPIGVKFLLFKPEGIKQIDKSLAACEMIMEAMKRGETFYFTKENEDCFGKLPLGWEDVPPWAESGQIGDELEIFQEARANARLYISWPKFPKGTVNYVVLSPLDKLTFEPDLLIILAKASQAEIVMRAMTFSTGEVWETKSTPALECSWLYVYPMQSGKVHYNPTGMTVGANAKKSFPEGMVLISIPYQWIPIIAQNMQEMKWVLPNTESKEIFNKRLMELIVDMENASQNP
jgi:uncharacterized protein (DUF169 family)